MTASDSQYKCCCNTHVHNAIIAIAIVGWLSGGGALIFIIISFLWPFLPLPMLAGLGNLLLLLGGVPRRLVFTVKAYKYLTQVLSEHYHPRDAVMIQQNQAGFSPSYSQVQQGGAYPGQGFQVPPGGFTGYPPVHSDSRHEFKPPVGGQQIYPNV
ncbi:unnamed protein product [Bursaphelenchus okinawaensis]|uniref:Uncharacterized protein n=1 Tax=Bursaphelenchus okinawaensis TaxID=465554 RepID=A0A811L5I1_9BILA|nr:unnamed protein product [Bursaphelenchus okinawaensis]CAG9117033.1 unnamed protein product [Bursaphelenchus okinawaensis]